MAVTENRYTGNGVTKLYPFTFEYIDETDVRVALDGADTTEYSFANATTIEMDTAPGVGVGIRIYRLTDTNSLPATFFSGSTIQANDLNDNFNVALFVAQEAQRDSADAGKALPAAERAEANSIEALNKATTAETNAATALSTATTALSTAQTADANANQAITDSSNALIAAGNALDQVSLAQDSAAAAEASAAAAELAAANAQSSADDAVTTANAAQTTANAAQTTANQANSTANTANSTANTANSNANTAITTANQAEAIAQAAADAVGDALLFESYPNLAALPAGTSGDAAEVIDSTGAESDGRLSGVPAGFVGDSGLRVRLIKNGTWQYQSYAANDPDNRYLNPTDAAQINSDIANAQATADAALPKSGGTMTGLIVFDPAQDFGVQDASTSVKGIVQLSNAINSTSQTLASTPNATKQAYDAAVNANSAAGTALSAANAAQSTANSATTTANGALQRTGGTMTGQIVFSSDQSFPADGIQLASTTQAGIVQLVNSVTSTTNLRAATPNSVKTAYDRGSQGVASANAAATTANAAAAEAAAATTAVAGKVDKAGDTMTGSLTLPGSTSGNRLIFGDSVSGFGIRLSDTNLIQMRGGNTAGLSVDATGAALANESMTAPYFNATNSGASGSPVYRFNDSDTGLYYASGVGSGAVRFSKNGSVQWSFSADELVFNTGDGHVTSLNSNKGYKLKGAGRGDDDPSYFSTDTNDSDARVMYTRGANSGNTNVFYANGSAANKQNDWGGTSDARLKENIVEAKPQWDDVKAYKFHTYNFIDDENQSPQFGVLAQELIQTSPGLVAQDGRGFYRVKTSVMTLKAIKALQEAMLRIEELENRLNALEG